MSWFIDKLSMHQEHPDKDLPIVGKHGVVRYDIATGEQVSSSVDSAWCEGSYSSKLQVRCNGRSVSISGNPSRFNRTDNLFGFDSIDDCVAIYNQVLSAYNLPPFTKTTATHHFQTRENERATKTHDGAIIRHIDWTRNHVVGQGNESSFLRGLSSQTIGRGLLPHLYPNGYTVDWGTLKLKYQGRGSKYRYDKVYEKAQDLLAHRTERLKNATEEEITYYDRLIEFCLDCGIVREEQSKKSPWLKRHGNLALYGLARETDFLPHLTDIENAITRLEVHEMTYQTIAEQLIAAGICNSAQSANATESYYLKWKHGSNLDRSKSQYHVHRSRLKQLGVDISIAHDITRIQPQIRRGGIITLQPATIPSWYRMPDIRHLKAA